MVEPLPAPYVVPIAVNRVAYVVLLIAEPSHKSQPEGAVVPAYGASIPAGSDAPPEDAVVCVVPSGNTRFDFSFMVRD